MIDLVLVRHIHNPTVHQKDCRMVAKAYAKPVTEQKARAKNYHPCPTCLPGFKQTEESHMAKQTKEERESEYLEAIQLLLGFPLMDYQKTLMLEIRAKSLAGQPLDLSQYRGRKS